MTRTTTPRILYAGRIGEVALVMGVSRSTAERALVMSRWDVDAAMDWLRRNTPAGGKRGGA